MKNKVFNNLICVILAVSLCFSYFALTASATSLTDELVEFSCAEPPADSNNGYIVIFYKTTSNKIMARLLAWNVTPVKNTIDDYGTSIPSGTSSIPSVQLSISSFVTLRFRGEGFAYYSIYDVTSDTNEFNNVQYGTCDFGETDVYRMQISPNDYLGYAIYGNGVVIHNDSPSETELYPVLFNDSKTQYNQMQQLIIAAQQIGKDTSYIDDIFANTTNIDNTLYELYILISNDIYLMLANIEYYNMLMQEYLLECKNLLSEIRDSLASSGPSFDESMGDDFGEDLNEYNPNDSIGSLPNISDGDKVNIIQGINIFGSITDNLLHYMPELKVAMTFVLLLGFVGFVLGRKLNKES